MIQRSSRNAESRAVLESGTVFTAIRQANSKLAAARVDFEGIKRRLAAPPASHHRLYALQGLVAAPVPILVEAMDPLMRLIASVGNISRFIEFHLTSPVEKQRALQSDIIKSKSNGLQFYQDESFMSSSSAGSSSSIAFQTTMRAGERLLVYTNGEAELLAQQTDQLLAEMKELEAEVLSSIGADVSRMKKVNENVSRGTFGIDRENFLASPIHLSRRSFDRDAAAMKREVLMQMNNDPRYKNLNRGGGGRNVSSHSPPPLVAHKKSVYEADLLRALDDVAKEELLQQFILTGEEPAADESPAAAEPFNRQQHYDPEAPSIRLSASQQEHEDIRDNEADREEYVDIPSRPIRQLSDEEERLLAEREMEALIALEMEQEAAAAAAAAEQNDFRRDERRDDLQNAADGQEAVEEPWANSQTSIPMRSTDAAEPDEATSTSNDSKYYGRADDFMLHDLSPPPGRSALDDLCLAVMPSNVSWGSMLEPLSLQSAANTGTLPSLHSPSSSSPPISSSAAAAQSSFHASLVTLEDIKSTGFTFLERLRSFVAKISALPTFPWTEFQDDPADRDSAYFYNHETSQRSQTLEGFYADEYAAIEVSLLLSSKEWRSVPADHPSNTSGREYFMNKALSATTWNLHEWVKEH